NENSNSKRGKLVPDNQNAIDIAVASGILTASTKSQNTAIDLLLDENISPNDPADQNI
ncbi:hypothetical protein HK100_010523, partial [Physocladia obscura]